MLICAYKKIPNFFSTLFTLLILTFPPLSLSAYSTHQGEIVEFFWGEEAIKDKKKTYPFFELEITPEVDMQSSTPDTESENTYENHTDDLEYIFRDVVRIAKNIYPAPHRLRFKTQIKTVAEHQDDLKSKPGNLLPLSPVHPITGNRLEDNQKVLVLTIEGRVSTTKEPLYRLWDTHIYALESQLVWDTYRFKTGAVLKEQLMSPFDYENLSRIREIMNWASQDLLMDGIKLDKEKNVHTPVEWVYSSSSNHNPNYTTGTTNHTSSLDQITYKHASENVWLLYDIGIEPTPCQPNKFGLLFLHASNSAPIPMILEWAGMPVKNIPFEDPYTPQQDRKGQVMTWEEISEEVDLILLTGRLTFLKLDRKSHPAVRGYKRRKHEISQLKRKQVSEYNIQSKSSKEESKPSDSEESKQPIDESNYQDRHKGASFSGTEKKMPREKIVPAQTYHGLEKNVPKGRLQRTYTKTSEQPSVPTENSLNINCFVAPKPHKDIRKNIHTKPTTEQLKRIAKNKISRDTGSRNIRFAKNGKIIK